MTLCLWRSNKLLPIFSEEGELQGIPGKIGVCLPISVSREDMLPKLICSRCIYKLETFSEFRNSCFRSEQLLKRYIVQETPLQAQPQLAEPFPQVPPPQLEVSDVEPEATVQEPPMVDVRQTEIATEQSPENTPATESTNSINTNLLVQNTAPPAKKRKVVKNIKEVHRSTNRSKKKTAKKRHNTVQKKKDMSCGITAKHSAVNRSGESSSRRNIHNCKCCSKNFASRLLLSRHLTSSSCLFRYTCRYCAKTFVSADTRLQHERNHKNKKNFMCGICRQIFQSSFELNVHAMQGCERSMLNGSQQTRKTKKKKQNTKQASLRNSHPCSLCPKVFKRKAHLQTHLRSCRRSANKIQLFQKKTPQKNVAQEVVSAEQNVVRVENTGDKNKTVNSRKPSRRKQILIPKEDPPVVENVNISPKASLLAVLGLKEKQNTTALKKESEMETSVETDTGRSSPDVIVVKEIVTICDICRKIFTSETAMINHQLNVHNRVMSAEKIQTLMRVEI
ncbi:hypothetical protein L9F63_013017 [Diploptera punctata]|uniref:Uncharacterized protein n=1 Tax=Diploptera punctata TaxID=6984 RepID=A0AAD8AB42_DIPPU|nr:hypothetical protein L9F63_013017 [Diploptera punctata]